jgi:hypothetical protein
MVEKGGGPFSWVVQAGYLDFCGFWESYESLSADWFGKSINTLELSLWIHSPGSEVTLMLRFGTTISTVGWNVLGLQLVGGSLL